MQTKMIPRTASYQVCSIFFSEITISFILNSINRYCSFPTGETTRIASLALGKILKSVGRVIVEIEFHVK